EQTLAPLSGTLTQPVVRAPQIPADVNLAALTAAATAPLAPHGADAPRETETAEAFHRIALRIARERPDLLQGPHGQQIADYVADVKASRARKRMAATAAAAPRRKRAKKTSARAKRKTRR